MSEIKLPKEDYPHGVCPFMSTGHIVPVNHTVEMKGAARFAQSPILVPCLGDQCQLWAAGVPESYCVIGATAFAR